MTTVLGNEQGFVEHYLKELSSRSVRYGQDYLSRSLPTSSRIKRQPIKKAVVETKEEEEEETSNTKEQTTTLTGATDTIELTIKILKPSSQFRITRLNLDDTVLTLKQRIYQQQTISVKQQRLLLKGKVLSDDKSLRDYNVTKDTVLHLMVSKPPATATTATTETMEVDSSSSPPPVSSSNVLSEKAKDTFKSDSSIWKSIEDVLNQHQVDSNDIQLILGKWKDSLSQ